jgi:dTMP kinase
MRRGGLFISFEGIEGAGKSTQVGLLMKWLESRRTQAILVREPGGTVLGEKIRELLLSRGQGGMDPWAELCLYEAARAQLVQEVIEPALAAGTLVVADRYADASEAYQGGGRRLGVARVRTLSREVTRARTPHRTYLLDLDPRLGLERIRAGRGSNLDRLESEPLSFHLRVRKTYLAIASRERDRFRVFDASRPVADLFELIRADLEPLF